MDIVAPLKTFLGTKEIDSTNTVWRLHNRATVYLLAFFTILLSARVYFGEPIDCISTAPPDVKKSMNTYCWILGTFISRDPKFVHASWDYIEIGEKMGHIPMEERLYQKYYQWVPFVLAIQAFLFSVPKYLWKFYEGKRMQTLCEDLTSVLYPTSWNVKRKYNTLCYLTQESGKSHTGYALVFLGCEMFNFVVVLVNMMLMNFIFGGFWNSYQPAMRALLSLEMNSWTSYNSLVFPKLAKCDFHMIGPSGSKQNFDALCLLPQNIVNEKIFAFLWLWFIILAVVSGGNFGFRLTQVCCESVRFQLLYSQLEPISYQRLKRVVRDASFGYWFILYQMSRNVNKSIMRQIIKELSKCNRSVQSQQNLERYLSQQNIEQQQQQEDVAIDILDKENDELEDDEVTV
ncbi:innexin inx4-like [Uranotaenia lowii]|uniref:innexin inx4-like n=1 Tax=Uranotaenia lowii TaxID=190385 RepID=UPI002478CE84|nr:innexin inx4-like [Uranotaenia lowii]